jgi:hypothetical protein
MPETTEDQEGAGIPPEAHASTDRAGTDGSGHDGDVGTGKKGGAGLDPAAGPDPRGFLHKRTARMVLEGEACRRACPGFPMRAGSGARNCFRKSNVMGRVAIPAECAVAQA